MNILSCCGCGGAPDDYAMATDPSRSRAGLWRARFKTLMTSLQVQLSAKPLHPRDQVFDALTYLYAHEVGIVLDEEDALVDRAVQHASPFTDEIPIF